jgi:6-phosphofructokinase
MSNQSVPAKSNVIIGQSGGPTAVINQSLVGIIEAIRGHPNASRIDKILGAHHAVSGIVKDDFIELQGIPQDRLNRVAQTPSAALGSSRDKPDKAYCKRILDVFEERNVRYFFYIGGNDSADTCRMVNDLAVKQGYHLHAFHVPKTIDNDLVHNDHTPGYASAAKFVAQSFMGDNLDNKALMGIKINIIMGRNAGFLTAASMLGRQHADDGPHLIYVPEASFLSDHFIADVDRVYSRFGRCLIAVSEGIHDTEGTQIMAKLLEEATGHVQKDAHGNVQLSGTGALGDYLLALIRSNMDKDIRLRADTFGYLQRSFAGCVSDVDAREAHRVGRRAVDLAMAGESSGSIAIHRVNNDPYKVEYRRIELADVAIKTRTLDPKYINDGCDIDQSFSDYLSPLVGNLPVTESLRIKH